MMDGYEWMIGIDVLKVLTQETWIDGFGYMSFKALHFWLKKYSISEIRLSCRYLKRKGYADFSSGLWSEDGEMMGSGYGSTKAGEEFLKGLVK